MKIANMITIGNQIGDNTQAHDQSILLVSFSTTNTISSNVENENDDVCFDIIVI